MAVLIYPSTPEQNIFDINCQAGNKGDRRDSATETPSLKRGMSSATARNQTINFGEPTFQTSIFRRHAVITSAIFYVMNHSRPVRQIEVGTGICLHRGHGPGDSSQRRASRWNTANRTRSTGTISISGGPTARRCAAHCLGTPRLLVFQQCRAKKQVLNKLFRSH